MGHVIVSAVFRGKNVLLLDNVLVDTSASFTILPLDLAEKYLFETPFETDLKLGDGRKVRAKVFVAEVEIMGRKGPVRVLAFPNAVPVIGVDTLETLGLKVNPSTGKLEKTEHYMLYV
ncbi:MAG: hypothetical protein B6U89_03615 [Desulfurococcales archaeon ex4484_58]|nr:MAG: hypothetical protein B6U89_03615 [Desulfurococcales archaeon ex4484_58]